MKRPAKRCLPRAGFQRPIQEQRSHPGAGSEWQSGRSTKLPGEEQKPQSHSKAGVPPEEGGSRSRTARRIDTPDAPP